MATQNGLCSTSQITQRVRPSPIHHRNPFILYKHKSSHSPSTLHRYNSREFTNYKPTPTDDTEHEHLVSIPTASQILVVSKATPVMSQMSLDSIVLKKTSKELATMNNEVSIQKTASIPQLYIPTIRGFPRIHKKVLSLDLDDTLIYNITEPLNASHMNYHKAEINSINGQACATSSIIFYRRPFLSTFLLEVSKLFDIMVSM